MDTREKKPLQRGQSLAEFALVFPLLFLLLVGIFEFGRIMFTYSVALAATREAARYGAAIQDIGGGIPQYEDCMGIREAAKRVGKFAGINDGDITIQYSDSGGVYSTSCPPSQEVGLTDSISVTVSTSVSPLAILGDFGPIPISSSSSRTILKKIKLGESGTGAGSLSGLATDVNFKTTSQTALESQGTIMAVLELNQIATDLVTIPFSVTGTAVQGVDYSLTPSPVTIPAGSQSTTIYITLANDGLDEGDEALFIGIDTPTNATKGPQNIHMVTIQDPPYVSFAASTSTRLENESSSALTIQLDKASSQDVTVPIVSGGTAIWGNPGDYQTSPNPVVIPAGTLSTLLEVTIYDDLIDEEDEIAALGLGAPTNAILGAIPMHLMTIVDNDDPPLAQFFFDTQIVSEEIGQFTTAVTLSAPSTKEITVPYTKSGTTIPADYVIHDPSPLVFPPGTITQEIRMDILEGDGWEEDETLILTLGTPTNADLGAPSEQTIIITESSVEPIVTFVDTSQAITEGDTTVEVLLSLSNAWNSEVLVAYTVSGTAAEGAGQDFELAAGSVSIPVGYSMGAIQVQINEDELNEVDETIILTLGTIVNGTAGLPDQHTITILDDDALPTVDFSGSQSDKVESEGTFSLTVLLDKLSDQDVTVPLLLSGSAADGSDYTISTTNLVIPAGSNSGSFDVTLIDDAVFENEEQLLIDLGAPTNAQLGTNLRYTVNIEDDELPLCETGTHLLTVGTDSLSWSITNLGEALVFTGGSVTWPEASSNKPRLTQISFDGVTVFSGSEKPTSFSYFAWEPFGELDTSAVDYTFKSQLGSGDYVLTANFQNAGDGTPCSLVENYHKP